MLLEQRVRFLGDRLGVFELHVVEQLVELQRARLRHCGRTRRGVGRGRREPAAPARRHRPAVAQPGRGGPAAHPQKRERLGQRRWHATAVVVRLASGRARRRRTRGHPDTRRAAGLVSRRARAALRRQGGRRRRRLSCLLQLGLEQRDALLLRVDHLAQRHRCLLARGRLLARRRAARSAPARTATGGHHATGEAVVAPATCRARPALGASCSATPPAPPGLGRALVGGLHACTLERHGRRRRVLHHLCC